MDRSLGCASASARRLPSARRAVVRAVRRPSSGICRGQVVLLADVVSQVVQLDAHVVEELDQLEVAVRNRAVGRRAALLVVLVVRVVPEQRVAFELAGLLQQRNEADAVQRVCAASGRRSISRIVGYRSMLMYGRVAHAARLRDAGPMDDQRHARAAFVAGAFADAEREVRRRRHAAAVVGREDHDRAIGDA